MTNPIAFINGWIIAPHCWKQYLLKPIQIDQAKEWTAVSVFGFFMYFSKSE
jgi:hypothetical protein